MDYYIKGNAAKDVRDLQIGDWIEDGYKKAQVTSITCDGIVETTAAISNIEVVEPIKLTEEILVKNGFKKNDRGDFVIDDTIVIAKENYCPKNYYACAWYQEDFDDELYYIGICELTFVHQLQHLLRLCGIEKELVID